MMELRLLVGMAGVVLAVLSALALQVFVDATPSASATVYGADR